VNKDDRDEFWRNLPPRPDNQLLVLLGILSGVVADGILVDSEIHYLSSWLSNNKSLTKKWPGNMLRIHIHNVLADGHISGDERASTMQLIQDICGNKFTETGAVDPERLTNHEILSFDDLDFSEVLYCFTGTFSLGTRRVCRSAVERFGARTTNTVSMGVDYLVVGDHTTRSWKFGSYGTKIDKALEWQRDNGKPIMVSEQHWVAQMNHLQSDDFG